MTAHAGQGEDVGLDAGATGGVGAGQGQHDGGERIVGAQGWTSFCLQ